MQKTGHSNPIGQKVDNYQIVEMTARHKISARYLAQTDAGESVYLEILDTGSGDKSGFNGRFRRHMRVLAQLKHPNIAPLLHVSHTSDNLFYTAAEPVQGITLAQKIEEWREAAFPPAKEMLALVRQLAEALAAVRPVGIIHYGLRPENITIKEDGTPVLTDLGVPLNNPIERDPSERVEMLDYESPEQLSGEPLDERSNIYSLGVILYELLAGHRPRLPSSSWDIFARSSSLPKEYPLEEARLGLAEETYQLTKICLWRQPWNRFDSPDDLIKAINTAILAEEYKVLPHRSIVKTLPWQYLVVPLLLITLILFGFFWTRSKTDVPPAPPPLSTTAVPAHSQITPNSPPPAEPTITLVPTPIITGDKILLLAPPPDAQFAESDTIHFDWYWPEPLDLNQQFFIQLLADNELQTIGIVKKPVTGSQYRLSLEVGDLGVSAGSYLWFIVLQKSDNSEDLFLSDLQSFSIHTSPPTATISPTTTPTADAILLTQTRLASCTPSSPPGWIAYTVKKDDYLFNLALDRNTTVDRLKAVNCLDSPALGIGMRLWLPILLATETPTLVPVTEITPTSGAAPDTSPPEDAVTKTPLPPPS